MKKQFPIRSLFMIVMFSLLSFAGLSQVATKAAQDTSNARLSLIKNASYSNSVSLVSLKKSNDTLSQSLRVIINSVDSNSVYSARGNSNQTNNTATLTLVKKSNDTIAQNTRAIIAKQYVQRPSEKSGRTYKSGALTSQTATANSYTVTGGKTLYVTSITLSAINSNTTIIGSVAIEDNTTIKVPVLIPISGATGINPSTFIQMDFTEPKQFTNIINVTVIAGTINYSMSWTGYEE